MFEWLYFFLESVIFLYLEVQLIIYNYYVFKGKKVDWFIKILLEIIFLVCVVIQLQFVISRGSRVQVQSKKFFIQCDWKVMWGIIIRIYFFCLFVIEFEIVIIL